MPASVQAFSLVLLIFPGVLSYASMCFFLNSKIRPSKFEAISLIGIFLVLIIYLCNVISTFLPYFEGAFFLKNNETLDKYINDFSIWPFVIAVLVGYVASVFPNSGYFYDARKKIAPRIPQCVRGLFASIFGFKSRKSLQFPWEVVFNENKNRLWLTVRFQDGTALTGSPKYFSDDWRSEIHQLYLEECVWYVPKKQMHSFVNSTEDEYIKKPASFVLLRELSAVVAIDMFVDGVSSEDLRE
ncbi:hypothetical protein PUV47_10140 [Pseudovibrio exalbescens]|uniref:hypothetical protein n=1 Tax=Pseudovibrio exalbescens TaxID=197461 RepID=UPI00236611FD|nr:hypothetical protein [Pseudovibrio exalbescens]MDD7910279.1 hypothetical protein [Pseudovibrio exalbescens]